MFRIALVLLASLLTIGCSTKVAVAPSALTVSKSATYDVPPKKMVEVIRTALAADPTKLAIEQDNDGVLLTGWQRFPGEWHVARRWQERTRFRIIVIPDWNEPTAKSRLEITPETEQRAAEIQDWQPGGELHRADRAKVVLDQIEKHLAGASARSQ